MTFNYNLTKEQLFSFHKKHIINTFKYKDYCIGMFIFIDLIWLIMFMCVGHTLRNSMIFPFVAMIIIFFILSKKGFLIKCQNTILKKLYFHDNLNYLFSKTTLTINKIGVTLDTILNKKTIKWKYIRDFYIIDNNVLIRSFSDYDIFIPSSSIKSKEDLNLLIDLFKENASIYPEYKYPKDIKFT